MKSTAQSEGTLQASRASGFKTLPGLARAFRRWAADANVPRSPDVAGASVTERQTLGALGGLAAAIGDEHVEHWPEQVRDWAKTAPIPPVDLTDAVRESLGRHEDPLSVLYESSISAPNRRRLGTVFTPRLLVDYMLELAADELKGRPPACVVDPGAGVGAFTLSAARRWPGARIVAVDINAVTLGLLAARLAFEIDADPEGSSGINAIELVLDDYLDRLPGFFADPAPGPVLALGNPPYTRIQELSSVEKRNAAELSSEIISSGHANLAVLFQAATLAHMRGGDVSCMVLPGSLSYTHASRGLRRELWNSRRGVSISRTPATTRAFAGRSVQAAVLMIGTERKIRTPLRLARVEIGDDSIEVIQSWKRSRTDQEPDNWFLAADSKERSAEQADSIPLSEIAAVHRGVATGANELFFLTDADAKLMPDEVLVPAMPTLRGFTGDTLDQAAHRSWGGPEARRWLLSIPPGHQITGPLQDRIRRYEDEVKDRHLPSKREPWYSITDHFQPQILISPLSKSEFRIVLNHAAAVPSNNLFGISLHNETNPERLADWLRSAEGQHALKRLARRYHGGSYKLEPGSLSAVEVPKSLELAT